MVLTGGIFVACNKDENVTNTKSNLTKSGQGTATSIEDETQQIIDQLNILVSENQDVVIATYNENENDFVLNFEKEKLFKVYEQAIKEKLGEEIAVNDIYIVDKKPFEKNYQAGIIVSTFDLNTSATSTMFIELRKVIDENGNISYYAPIVFSNGSASGVICKSTDCGEGECVVKEDPTTGKPYDCTNCPNKCEKTSSGGTSTATPSEKKNFWEKLATFLGKILNEII